MWFWGSCFSDCGGRCWGVFSIYYDWYVWRFRMFIFCKWVSGLIGFGFVESVFVPIICGSWSCWGLGLGWFICFVWVFFVCWLLNVRRFRLRTVVLWFFCVVRYICGYRYCSYWESLLPGFLDSGWPLLSGFNLFRKCFKFWFGRWIRVVYRFIVVYRNYFRFWGTGNSFFFWNGNSYDNSGWCTGNFDGWISGCSLLLFWFCFCCMGFGSVVLEEFPWLVGRYVLVGRDRWLVWFCHVFLLLCFVLLWYRILDWLLVLLVDWLWMDFFFFCRFCCVFVLLYEYDHWLSYCIVD